jgi:glycosyltransferase involved in cell wall biosynthesis
MKIILIGNSDLVIYNFRKELIISLINGNHEVVIICPYGNKVEPLISFGAKYVHWSLNRHSKNPFKEFLTFLSLSKILKKEKCDFVLSFTIKPNIYSGLLSRIHKFKHIPNITGLGQVFSHKSILRNLIVVLYKISFKNSKVIFLQNSNDLNLFKSLDIFQMKLKLIPGSGVNINEFSYAKYPSAENGINFLYLGRIMEQKGFDLFIKAAKFIKANYKNIEFIVCGFPEKGYEKILNKAINEKIIIYKGNLINIKPIIKLSHCLIQPSYYPEGISNVILEASATGRPVITSDNVGCGEAVTDKQTGLIFQKKNFNDLVNKIEFFIDLSIENKIEMGIKAREFIVKYYNREIIVQYYLSFIMGG